MAIEQLLHTVGLAVRRGWSVVEPMGAALSPLLKMYPWPGLACAFLALMLLLTMFRVATSFLLKLLLLPFMLVSIYVLFVTGSLIYVEVAPLVSAKFRSFF